MADPQGVRLPWDHVPAAVRAEVERALGAEVVEAVNQPGGFSPSLAARCQLADGSRVFLKAVSPAQNPHSVVMLRHEASVTAALPDGFPAPRLLATIEVDDWFAAAFEDVDGSCPELPWTDGDLDTVVAAVDALADDPVAAPPSVRPIDDVLGGMFSGWRTLAGGAAGGGGGLDPWAARHLDRLAETEAAWAEAAGGPWLVHVDVRADNVLLADDRVWFVDWANAAAGAHWVDVVFLAPSVGLDGGPPPESVVARSRLVRAVEPDAVTAVVAAVTGYFVQWSTLPPPPGLPTVRAFQAAQGEVGVAWLRERTGWR